MADVTVEISTVPVGVQVPWKGSSSRYVKLTVRKRV